MSVQVEAWAKVNLYLHVVGKRADGYHLLDSLVAFAGTGDTVMAEPAPVLSLQVDGPGATALPPGEENIVLTAARALAARAGIIAGATLHLTKRLPVAAGIGGGSADAAAALIALARLWKLSLPAAEMQALALSLGADVPVCLAGAPMIMSGIGERLEPAPPLPPAWLVLVNPRLPLHTPAVFKARRGEFSSPAPVGSPPADAHDLARVLAQRSNDLTEAAISLMPVVAQVLSAMGEQSDCLLARMSGSGATCFGLFPSLEAAETAAAALERAHPEWWIASAALLS